MKIKSTIKKILIPISFLLILMYITTYIVSLTSYYETIESNNTSLTNEAIKRFENDVLNGEKIVASNYLEEKKNNDNLFSRTSIKLGNIIENIFNIIMKSILKEVEQAIKYSFNIGNFIVYLFIVKSRCLI